MAKVYETGLYHWDPAFPFLLFAWGKEGEEFSFELSYEEGRSLYELHMLGLEQDVHELLELLALYLLDQVYVERAEGGVMRAGG
jgi:hypothetical protein